MNRKFPNYKPIDPKTRTTIKLTIIFNHLYAVRVGFHFLIRNKHKHAFLSIPLLFFNPPLNQYTHHLSQSKSYQGLYTLLPALIITLTPSGSLVCFQLRVTVCTNGSIFSPPRFCGKIRSVILLTQHRSFLIQLKSPSFSSHTLSVAIPVTVVLFRPRLTLIHHKTQQLNFL